MTTAPFSGGDTRRRVLGDLTVGLPVALVVAVATWSLLDLPATYTLRVLALYAAVSGLILTTVPADLPGPGFGLANRITLVRLLPLLSLAALAFRGGELGDVGRWWVVALGTAIMVLDGVDGRIARSTSTQTRFGARFDMETDAFLLLVLSVLVWSDGRAGAWVVLIGAMRYLFVAAAWLLPALRGELPPSLRRKVVCVVAGITLLVSLGPIIPDPIAVGVAAVGLAALSWSFAVDVVWLFMNHRARR